MDPEFRSISSEQHHPTNNNPPHIHSRSSSPNPKHTGRSRYIKVKVALTSPYPTALPATKTASIQGIFYTCARTERVSQVQTFRNHRYILLRMNIHSLEAYLRTPGDIVACSVQYQ
jgi:hypothetical protein